MNNHVRRRIARSLTGPLAVTLLVLASVALRPGVASAGVGIAPISLTYDDSLRGGVFSQSLLLSNEPSTLPNAKDAKSLKFSVKSRGEVAPWVSFAIDGKPETADKLAVALSNRIVLQVLVRVPADAPNREYSGNLLVEAEDATNAVIGSGAGVSTAAEIPLIVNVGGTERREANVTDYVIPNGEVGSKQRFVAQISNSGNVSVGAQLDVSITRNHSNVADLSTKGSNFSILPAKSDSVFVEWDTAEQLVGGYVATMTARDVSGPSPVVLGTRTVPFRLEQRGTFTRTGEFVSLVLTDKPDASGGLAVAEAKFFNTGKIEASAVFDGKLSLNGKLIKEIQSLPRAVAAGVTTPLGISFEATKNGDYRLEGSINFDGQVTKSRSFEFNVAGDGATVSERTVGSSSSSSTSKLFGLMGGGLAVVGLGGLAFLRVRRRR